MTKFNEFYQQVRDSTKKTIQKVNNNIKNNSIINFFKNNKLYRFFLPIKMIQENYYKLEKTDEKEENKKYELIINEIKLTKKQYINHLISIILSIPYFLYALYESINSNEKINIYNKTTGVVYFSIGEYNLMACWGYVVLLCSFYGLLKSSHFDKIAKEKILELNNKKNIKSINKEDIKNQELELKLNQDKNN